ncbi:MAG: hypothetical protein AAF787_10400 [Chloroflexota bacterium]
MMPLPQRNHWTETDYLAFEHEQHDAKHELIDSEIFAMAGASREHYPITGTHISPYTQLRKQSCELYHVKIRYSHVYPDIAVVCGQPMMYEQINFNTDASE